MWICRPEQKQRRRRRRGVDTVCCLNLGDLRMDGAMMIVACIRLIDTAGLRYNIPINCANEISLRLALGTLE